MCMQDDFSWPANHSRVCNATGLSEGRLCSIFCESKMGGFTPGTPTQASFIRYRCAIVFWNSGSTSNFQVQWLIFSWLWQTFHQCFASWSTLWRAWGDQGVWRQGGCFWSDWCHEELYPGQEVVLPRSGRCPMACEVPLRCTLAGGGPSLVQSEMC